MSYVVFARKWRPKDFDEVIGQEHITTTLRNAISNNRVAHAYIFTGPRGIGKTSIARIFAKGLNCEKGPTTSPCNSCASCDGITSSASMDVIEIDGASNNSVDQVRELRENIKFMPSYGRYKVYIIDEVHMLSIGAFNALLKTLEEPPKHAKFIFATTNPEKVPPTVLSRCQRFDFVRISLRLIISKLNKIVEAEKLDISDDAVFSIAKASDGSMRDAESVLDQMTSFCEKKIAKEDVINLLGIIEEDKLADIVGKLSLKDTAGILKAVDDVIAGGKDISQFLSGLLGYLRNLMVLKVSSGLTSLVDLPDAYIDRLKDQMNDFRLEELLYMFYTVSAAANAIKRSEIPRFIVEASLIKLSLRAEMMSLAEIMDKVAELEKKRHTLTGTGKTHPYGHRQDTNRESIVEEPADIAKESAIAGAQNISDYPERLVVSAVEPPMVSAVEPSRRAIAPAEEEAEIPVEKSDAMAALTIDEVKKKWPAVVQAIKSKKMSVASYLLEGELTKVTGSVITLSFAKRFNFYKEALEGANNKKFVEKIASDILGKAIELEVVVLEKAETPPERPEEVSELDIEEELEHEVKRDAFNEPIIQSAIDIFDGKIVKGKERRPANE